jgi:hypothetical protein
MRTQMARWRRTAARRGGGETMPEDPPKKKKKKKSGKGTDRATVEEGQLFIQRAEARKAAKSKARS